MKRNLFLALALMAGFFTASAQEYYEVNTAPDVRSKAYRPNEVIVKFRTDGAVAVKKNAQGRFKSAGVSSVDKVLPKYGVADADQLMPLTGKLPANAPRKVRGYNGKEFELKDLSKLYCLKISENSENSENSDLSKLIEELQALPEVEFAEPNYLVYMSLTPDPSPEGRGVENTSANQNSLPTGEGWGEADPLYTEQWGIPAINLPQLWQKPTITDHRPVIAILDTGVEIAHPDLAANIWTNEAETAGSTGYDDDQNGFTDDVHGWDFVNQTGYIDDYNGHGTHCAGIAAATGGNGLGIVGANPDALIMPVTVMQSDGTGDIATIIRGIDYAAANGADVISMSFGGYSYSIAEEQALGRAYATAVLVAAAGNDCLSINPTHKCERCGNYGSPMFPAAFTFVLGVQATVNGGGLAGFSNYDNDGPIYSTFGEEQLYNYELKAPGTTVVSTFSNGGYKALNGTSMACPLVAGAVSRLLQTKEYATKELLFGDLIHAANGGNVNMLATYNITDADRKPNLSLVSWRIEDEKDNDSRFDAGEIIKFYPMLRNDWGTAENIQVWMEMGDQESHSVLSFNQAMISSSKTLSSYAKAELENPITFRMSDDVVDGRHIRLVLYAQCDGMDVPSAQEIVITAENGVEIGGMVEHDMTLDAGVNYIVTRALVLAEGVSLTINPGACLKFRDGTGIAIGKNTRLKAQGTPNQIIVFKSTDGEVYNRMFIDCVEEKDMSYCKFENVTIDCPLFNLLKKNCILENCLINNVREFEYSTLTDVRFVTNSWGYVYAMGEASLRNNNILNSPNIVTFIYTDDNGRDSAIKNAGRNNILNNDCPHYCNTLFNVGNGVAGKIYHFDHPFYFGSSIESKVRETVRDIENPKTPNVSWKIDLSNILTQPNPEAHGVVWKVCVNDYDAQDEFDQLPALGVGRHKFEVWYSKKIDETVAPTIAMGVRPPYTQTAIAENGEWRTETVRFLPNGNVVPEFKNVVNGNMDNGDSDWSIDNRSGSSSSSSGKTGFDGGYCYVYSSVVCKFYQNLGAVPNGIYRFTFKAQPTNLANNNTQYIYANGDKTYLDSTEPKVYEVITTVTNNQLEVGFEQLESAGDGYVYLDDANLELLEEHPYGYDLEVSVYTANLTIKGGMAIDGLNRIYVNGGRDLEYFDIPREDTRFNVEVAAAGSMSTGFFGEAGIGKVTLTWEDQDENVDDILGYNMYRYTERPGKNEDGYYDENWNWVIPETVNDTIKINQRLLTDTEYVDYDVVPGTTYNYYYKILRTSLTENSPSRVVAVTPVTASKGDSNGSMTVDVADVVTTINYLTGQNPQPFLFDAADVNEDQTINILDIVGTINIIVNPASAGTASIGEAVYTIEDGVLWVDTETSLAGIQVYLTPSLSTGEGALTVTPCADLDGFEIVNTGSLFLAYSMSGKTLAPGKHALLQLGDATIENIVLSDVRGRNVQAVAGDATLVTMAAANKTAVGTPYAGTIPYYIEEAGRHTVRIEIYDALGHIQHLWNGTVDSGKHSYTWSAPTASGIYFAVVKVDGKMVGTAKMVK